MTRIIFFELNEVPRRIVEEFCDWRPHSHLARHLRGAERYDTHAVDAGHLSPWVTWPTVHRGVDNTRHGIADFGQPLEEVNACYPTLWSMIADAGAEVGVFGSLHSELAPLNRQPAFYVPDTFAAGSECFPKQLSAFQEFNLRMTRRSARNVAGGLDWQSARRFLQAAPGLGLRLDTAVRIGAQLVAERARPWRRARRRTCQVLVAFDLFMRQLRKTKPTFATFFTNHVASSMHRYWAARFPGEYDEMGYDERWRATYRHEIDYTMQAFDRMLGQLLKFIGRETSYQLWVVTSMGQAATTAVPCRTELNIVDIQRFMAVLGLTPGDWEQRSGMWPDTCLRITPAHVESFNHQLRGLRIDHRPLDVKTTEDGFVRIRCGQANVALETLAVELANGERVQPQTLGLDTVKIDDASSPTAYHIPEGVLLKFSAERRMGIEHATPMPTTGIAADVLRTLKISLPAHLQTRRSA